MGVVLKLVKNSLLVTIGAISLALGLVGIAVPILPGIPLIALAALSFTLLLS